MSAPRHPLITVAVIAIAGAAAVVLALVLVVNLVLVPLGQAVDQAPGRIAHAYEDYWNGVGQQFLQARQQDGGTP
jgi:hypothetical protein